MRAKIDDINSLLLRIDTRAPSFQLRFYHRILFTIILGLLSYFFAQTVSGSSTHLFLVWQLFYYFPLYLVHIVVLGWICLWVTEGRPTLGTLFVAGKWLMFVVVVVCCFLLVCLFACLFVCLFIG
jgi:hypothetical protein